MRAIDRILVVCYVALAALPVIAMLGELRDRRLDGAIPPAPRPSPTFSAIQREQFQHDFTAWFESSQGFRNYAIYLDNTALYHAFGETKPGSNVRIGGQGVLYERDDVTFFNKTAEMLPTDDQLDQLAAQLARVQQRLRERGQALVPVVVPSKTSVWRDAVPARWTRELGATRPSDLLHGRLLAALATHQVAHVDALQILTTPGIPRERLWGADARHWSSYGACLVLHAIVELHRELAAASAPPEAPCGWELRRVRRSHDDFDLLRLLNAWGVPRAAPLTPIALHTPPPPGTRTARAMFISTSFGWQLLREADASRRFSATWIDYYDKTLFGYPAQIEFPVRAHEPLWRLAMMYDDLYVIELFEPYLLTSPDHFVGTALAALEAELASVP
ncbi:MAG: alginate O-acetyltransferase AlgX-related protein [Kofleriaceae bacterium]